MSTKNNDKEVDINIAEEEFLEDVDQNFRWKDISIEGWICLPIFWILACVVFWQFFTRYALNDSAVWTEELARQLLILLTFFGAAYAMTTQAHISINYFIDKIKGRPRKIVYELVIILQFGFFLYGGILCLNIAKTTQFQRLMHFDISKSYVYTAVALSLFVMALRTTKELYMIIKHYKGKPVNQQDANKNSSNGDNA